MEAFLAILTRNATDVSLHRDMIWMVLLSGHGIEIHI